MSLGDDVPARVAAAVAAGTFARAAAVAFEFVE
jgi:hypothetical protein